MSGDLYKEFGVRRVVNAMGHVTVLGGSVLSPGVQAAMEDANTLYVSMDELLDKTGAAAADLLGAEGALVTSGAFAALVTGIAGIMTGDDPDKIAQLPDTTGMKNEFLLQKKTRYRYDRCITTAGGKLVEIGDENGTTPEQLRAAIGPQTAGILYFARAEKWPGVLGLQEVIDIAHEHDIRVVVDAAGEIYPLTRMRWLPSSGADLLCFGAKYLGAGNSCGILCGRAEYVRAAKLNGFIGYEAENNRSIGRGYKIDRQEVVGTVVGLREWLERDHEERLHTEASRIDAIMGRVADLPNVSARNVWEEEKTPWMRMKIELDPALSKTPAQVVAELKQGDPSVWVRLDGESIFVEVHTLKDDEVEIVAERLRAVLT